MNLVTFLIILVTCILSQWGSLTGGRSNRSHSLPACCPMVPGVRTQWQEWNRLKRRRKGERSWDGNTSSSQQGFLNYARKEQWYEIYWKMAVYWREIIIYAGQRTLHILTSMDWLTRHSIIVCVFVTSRVPVTRDLCFGQLESTSINTLWGLCKFDYISLMELWY